MKKNEQYVRNNLFDLIKMICIFMVVLTHISWSKSERMFFFFPYIIDMAVPLFLIISTYLRTKKIESVGLKKYLSFKYSLISFMNLIVAYVIVFLIEILISLVMKNIGVGNSYYYLQSFSGFIKWFITGLSGPGSYYVPLMIQLIVYFPIIFLLFKKGRNKGVIACFIINLIYELLVYYFNFDSELYRLLIFRYTLLIGFGIYLASSMKEKKDDFIAIILFALGFIYITINKYIWTFPLFQNWKATSMLCAPYAYGIMYFLMKWFSGIEYKKCYVFGKASYHIFLVQMVFYNFGANAILLKILSFLPSVISKIIGVIISIVVCFGCGFIFYLVETKIRKKIHISH